MKAIKTLKLLKELKHTMNTVELFRFVVNYDKLEKAIKELEKLSGSKQLVDNHTCEGCKYGKFGVDSIGIEVECSLNWDCSRGRIDRWEGKE